MEKYTYKEEDSQRLDLYLRNFLEETRSQIKKSIEEEKILVNGKKVKAGYQLLPGDEISLEKSAPYEIFPQDLHLDILYEDEDLLVVNKPKGLVVHPGAGEEESSLVHGLLYLYPDLPVLDDPLRPGIVHRLDKDTEGLLLVAKNKETMEALFAAFKERKVKKTYQCLVHGHLKEEVLVDEPLGRSPKDRKKMAVVVGGRPALSIFRPRLFKRNKSLVDVSIITGRTHQIRVHAAFIGHPILGDRVYSHKPFYGLTSQALASVSLSFVHPKTGKTLTVTRETPEYFHQVLEK